MTSRTTSAILAMAQERWQRERRMIHNLRRSWYRTHCVAAVDRSQRDVLVANHKAVLCKPRDAKEVKLQYYDLNIAFGW